MNFSEAKNHKLTWGKYSGQAIDDAASTDRGLSWLTWMLGILETEGDLYFSAERRNTREALRVYLTDPTIAADVAKISRSN